MIVAEQKPLDEILSALGVSERVLLVGCHGCVTVCAAGGEKECQQLGHVSFFTICFPYAAVALMVICIFLQPG